MTENHPVTASVNIVIGCDLKYKFGPGCESRSENIGVRCDIRSVKNGSGYDSTSVIIVEVSQRRSVNIGA